MDPKRSRKTHVATPVIAIFLLLLDHDWEPSSYGDIGGQGSNITRFTLLNVFTLVRFPRPQD